MTLYCVLFLCEPFAAVTCGVTAMPNLDVIGLFSIPAHATIQKQCSLNAEMARLELMLLEEMDRAARLRYWLLFVRWHSFHLFALSGDGPFRDLPRPVVVHVKRFTCGPTDWVRFNLYPALKPNDYYASLGRSFANEWNTWNMGLRVPLGDEQWRSSECSFTMRLWFLCQIHQASLEATRQRRRQYRHHLKRWLAIIEFLWDRPSVVHQIVEP